MDLIELVVLALIQGLTEFLPISSSAHLILPSKLFGWHDQGLTYDVAVHFGTLIAVVSYYRHKVFKMARDVAQHPKYLSFSADLGRVGDQEAFANVRLFKQVIFASIPVLSVGFFFQDWIEHHFRSLWVIAFTTLFFGVLLGVAEYKGKKTMTMSELTFTFAMVIGVAQALALVPGTSRSGITITAALLIGMRSEDSAHFSFLLSIPTILAATSLQVIALVQQPENFVLSDLLWAGSISGLSAYLTIALFIKLLDKVGMMPFVVYRLVLGCYLLYILN